MRTTSERIALLADRIRDLVAQLYNYYVPPFKITPTVLPEDRLRKLLSKIPGFEEWRWIRLDSKYYTVDLATWKKIVKWDWSNVKRYLVDQFDCDDYAGYFKFRVSLLFRVNAVAYVLDYGSAHSYNIIFPSDTNEPLIYEPQTDEIIKIPGRDKRFYDLENFYLLIL